MGNETKEILEVLKWFKENLPSFAKHNSSSQETKDGFRDLGLKIDKKMDKSTFFSLIGTVTLKKKYLM
jgi:hypothetical protein